MTAVALAALVLTVVFTSWQYWLFRGGVFRTRSFDRTEWHALGGRPGDFSCYRGGMARDIQTNLLRTGLTRSQVESLLGSPDTAETGVQAYALGWCSGFRTDVDTLDVHFNAEGRLEKVLIVQH